MPIKGMTDREMSFPEIGKIRKGGMKPTEGKPRPGSDLKYFRVEFDEQETGAIEKFSRVYGGQPDEINVVLPFNEIERCWDAWLEAYTAGRMVARTDGETFEYQVSDTGEVLVKNGIEIATGKPKQYIEGQVVGKDNNGKPVYCKPSGRLKVVIPELERLAFMTVLTGSVHDIVNISGQLEAIQKVNNGNLAGIPLKLRRRPKKISVPRGGNRVRMEKWLISIEADPEYVKAKLIDLKHRALPGNGLDLVEGQEEELEQLTAGSSYDGYEDYDDDEYYDGEIEENAQQTHQNTPTATITHEAEKNQNDNDFMPVSRASSTDVQNDNSKILTLREQIKSKVSKMGDYPASAKQRQLLRFLLDDIIFQDSKGEKRHQVLYWLFGNQSTAESDGITGAEVKVLLDFLNAERDSGGQYVVPDGSVKACNEIARQEQIDKGQLVLELV